MGRDCACLVRPLFFVSLALAAALGSGCSSGSTRSTPSGASQQTGAPDAASEAGAVAVTLASGIDAYYLTVDSTNVYAAAESDIFEVPIKGGTPVTLATITQNQSIGGLAVSGARVYWAETDFSGMTNQLLILSVPVGGGTVATVATTAGFATALAIDDGNVYWATTSTGGASCSTSACSTLSSVPLAGGTPQTLTASAGNPALLAFDDASVYWTTADGRVLKEPKAGGSITTLADFESVRFTGLGLEGSSLYWAESGGDIYATPIGGGTSKPLEIGIDSIQAAAVGADGVYWVSTTYTDTGETSSIARTPLDGGATQDLWPLGSDSANAMAVDSTSIYVSTYMGGLVKLSK
jgi:hypothetical protein